MSLHELILAAVVFVCATLPVLTLFTSTGRERRQGPDHALALGLAAGAVEALAAAAVDDPDTPAEVARAGTLPAAWPAREPEPAVWRAMAGFRGELASQALAERVDFSLTLGWTADGDERELTLAFAFPAPQPATDAAPPSKDAPGPGEVVALVRGLDAGLADGPGPGGDARVAFVRAGLAYQRAARRVRALVRLASLLQAPAAKLPPAARPDVERLDRLPGELEDALASAFEDYGRVAQADPAPPRVRGGALRRAVEAGTLLALTRRPEVFPAVLDLLDRASAGGGDRAAWARRERASAHTLQAMRASYGAPARLEALATYDRVMPRARSDLLALF